jgi:hypothetical protein
MSPGLNHGGSAIGGWGAEAKPSINAYVFAFRSNQGPLGAPIRSGFFVVSSSSVVHVEVVARVTKRRLRAPPAVLAPCNST